MATATKKPRASLQVARPAAAATQSAAITFRVFEDNGGSHHWTLLGTDGENLAHSRPYATHEQAAHGAGVVRDGAGTARLETARAPAVARDDSDAERWLDEGGSFSSQGVTQ